MAMQIETKQEMETDMQWNKPLEDGKDVPTTRPLTRQAFTWNEFHIIVITNALYGSC
jgi:hypothetical protein